MIRFSLSCADGHRFDSWFQSSDAFDTLQRAGHLSCAVCGSTDVKKALMAPAVSLAETDAQTASAPSPTQADAPEGAQKAIAELRKKVEETSDYVGLEFAAEARAMHLGDIPERPIYGEAGRDEAKALIEDGVPVAPLPFLPRKVTN